MTRFSATRIAAYGVPDESGVRRDGCPRKWFFEEISGHRRETEALKKGTAVHLAIERWLKDGTLPDGGETPCDVEIANRALSGIQSLRRHMEENAIDLIEAEYDFKMDLGFCLFEGQIDFLGYMHPGLPAIGDHKTLSDWKYAKTSDELIDNVQINCYAYWALQEFAHARQVHVFHNQIVTRGAAKAKVGAEAVLEREHVERNWNKYLTVLEEQACYAKLGPEGVAQVPADGMLNGECEAYGGCPHAGPCGASWFKKPKKEGSDMADQALMDKIAALKAKRAGEAAPAPKAEKTAPPPKTVHAEKTAPAPKATEKTLDDAIRCLEEVLSVVQQLPPAVQVWVLTAAAGRVQVG